MKKFFIILFFGFLVWVIPYGISLLLNSAGNSSDALHFLIVIVVTVLFLVIYFKRSFSGFTGESFIVGIIWFGICISMDYLFLETQTAFQYYLLHDGLIYLAIPIIAIGYDLITKRKIW